MLILFFLALFGAVFAQSNSDTSSNSRDFSATNQLVKKDAVAIKKDTTRPEIASKHKKINIPQKDIRDVFRSVFNLKQKPASEEEKKDLKKHFSIIPAAGYTLQTGFAGLLSANMAYNMDTSADAKMSSITTNFTYTQYNQILIPFQASLWTKGNRYKIISDFRYVSYPSDIYGL